MVLRAVQLEIIQNMISEESILGLNRFISQRGTPLAYICDNVPQFKLASKVLTSVWRDTTRCDDIQSYVSERGVKWSSIVELAPWMGSFTRVLLVL